MRILISVLRFALAALLVLAVSAAYQGEVKAGGGALPNPFNFFGLFTIQNNLLAAFGLLLMAFLHMRDEPAPKWLPAFRGSVVAYLAVVGTVYAVLLAPIQKPGDILVPWANVVMHTVAPLALALDWILVADRPALRWRRIWVVLPYPVVWLTVVLIRGATDGWVPYPFLEPSNGAGMIAIVCVGICVVLLAVYALVTLVSRLRLIRPTTLGVDRIADPPTASTGSTASTAQHEGTSA